tara:strand:+ start:1548 stop:3557 length:2010 start_codon:yes stop_codon:yes gene_type:complete
MALGSAVPIGPNPNTEEPNQKKRKRTSMKLKAARQRLKQGVHLVWQGIENAMWLEQEMRRHKQFKESCDKNPNVLQQRVHEELCKSTGFGKPTWKYITNDYTFSQLQFEMDYDQYRNSYTFTAQPAATGALLDFEYRVDEKKIQLHYFYYSIADQEDKKKFPPYMTMYFLCMLADSLGAKIAIPTDASKAKSLVYNEKDEKWELEYKTYYGRYGFEPGRYADKVRKPCPKEEQEWVKENCGNEQNEEQCRKSLQERKERAQRGEDKSLPPQCFLRTTQNVLALADLNLEKRTRFVGESPESIKKNKPYPTADYEYMPNGRGTLTVYDENGVPTKYKGKVEQKEGVITIWDDNTRYVLGFVDLVKIKKQKNEKDEGFKEGDTSMSDEVADMFDRDSETWTHYGGILTALIEKAGGKIVLSMQDGRHALCVRAKTYNISGVEGEILMKFFYRVTNGIGTLTKFDFRRKAMIGERFEHVSYMLTTIQGMVQKTDVDTIEVITEEEYKNLALGGVARRQQLDIVSSLKHPAGPIVNPQDSQDEDMSVSPSDFFSHDFGQWQLYGDILTELTKKEGDKIVFDGQITGSNLALIVKANTMYGTLNRDILLKFGYEVGEDSKATITSFKLHRKRDGKFRPFFSGPTRLGYAGLIYNMVQDANTIEVITEEEYNRLI